jgi:hypothetical protein
MQTRNFLLYLLSSFLFWTQPSMFHFYFQVPCYVHAHCVLVWPIYEPFIAFSFVSICPVFEGCDSAPVLFPCASLYMPFHQLIYCPLSFSLSPPSPSPRHPFMPWGSSSQMHRLIFLYLFFIYNLSMSCLITPISSSVKRLSISVICSQKTLLAFFVIVSARYFLHCCLFLGCFRLLTVALNTEGSVEYYAVRRGCLAEGGASVTRQLTLRSVCNVRTV